MVRKRFGELRLRDSASIPSCSENHCSRELELHHETGQTWHLGMNDGLITGQAILKDLDHIIHW